jgi:hypothetical protein
MTTGKDETRSDLEEDTTSSSEINPEETHKEQTSPETEEETQTGEIQQKTKDGVETKGETQTGEGEQKEKTVKAETGKLKEKEKAIKEKAEGLFKQYPKAAELHFTSDGYAFFGEHDARNHAFSLKEKEVITIKNKSYVTPR